jgi:hypothetical protein
MTRLSAKYRDTTDVCIRCADRPTSPPDGMGSGTDAEHVALMYRCEAGHCWQRTFRRADIKGHPANATSAPRRHVANRVATTTAPTTTTTDADHTDVAHLSKATRQPSPRTTWHPTRRLWEPR